MSVLTNSHWYDDSGNYVPLSDRDIRDNDAVAKALKEHNGVEEYTQVGGYIHCFVTSDVAESELRHYMGMCLNTDLRVVEQYEHTYRHINGNWVIKLQMI